MDLFSIGFKADATQIQTATAALDQMTAAADRASSAAKRLNEQNTRETKRMADAATAAHKAQTSALTIEQRRQLELWRMAGAEFNNAEKAKVRAATDAARLIAAAAQQAAAAQIAAQRQAASLAAAESAKMIAGLRQIGEAARTQAAAGLAAAAAQAQYLVGALRGIGDAAKAQAAVGLERAAAQARALTGAMRQLADVAKMQATIALHRQQAQTSSLANAMRQLSEVVRFQAQIQRQAAAAATAHADAQRRLAATAAASAGAAGTLSGNFRGLYAAIATLGIVRVIKEVTDLTDSFTRMNAKLALVTNSAGELASAQAGLFDIAQGTRSAYEDTVNLYARLARNVKNLGLSQNEMLTITKAVNQSFRISGATAAEASGSIIQFGQALASGVLRGQELNSITEQAPRLFDAILTGIHNVDPALGLTRANFRKMAEEGKISSDLIAAAMKNQAHVIEAEFAKMPRTIAEALVQMRNQFNQAFSGVNSADLVRSIDETRATLANPAVAQSIVVLAAAYMELYRFLFLLGAYTVRIGQDLGEIGALFSLGVDKWDKAVEGVNDKLKLTIDLFDDIGVAVTKAGKAQTSLPLMMMGAQNSAAPFATNDQIGVRDAERAEAAAREQTRLTETQAEAAKKLAEEIAKARQSYAEQIEDQRKINKLLADGVDLQIATERVQMARGHATKQQIADLQAEKAITEGIAEARKIADKAKEDEAKRADDRMQLLDDLAAEIAFQQTLIFLLGSGVEATEAQARAALELQIIETGMGEVEAEQARARLAAALAGRKIVDDHIGQQQALADRIAQTTAEIERLNGANTTGQLLPGFSDEQLDSFSKAFDGIDLIRDAVAEIAPEFSEAFDKGADAAKLFAIAAKQSGEQAFSTYAKGAALAVGALQGMTREGTSAYKALGIAQAALTAIAAVGAVVNQAQGDPYSAFARMAAMVAALASLGVQVGGAFSGGGGSEAPAGAGAGQGTVLGDPEAVSQSIANAVEITADAAQKLVGLNSRMLQALQSLQIGITGLGHLFARSGTQYPSPGLSGGSTALTPGLDPAAGLMRGIGLGGVSDALSGLSDDMSNAIFGGQQHILSQGVTVMAASFADYLNRSVVRASALLQTEGGWFSDDEVETIFADLPAAMGDQFRLVFQSIADTVTEAAASIGVDPAAITAAFANIDLSQITLDTSGKTGEELAELLNGFFSALLDTVAIGVMPNLAEFQHAGEGAGETLVRLATEFAVLKDAIESLSLALTPTIEIADALTEAFGGVNEMAAATAQFYDFVLSDEQRLARETAALTRMFDDLSLGALPATRDGVLALVQGLRLEEAADRARYVAILSASEALDSYYTYIERAAKAAADAAAKAAADEQRRLADLARAAEEAARALAAFLEHIRQVRQSLERAIFTLGGGSGAAFDIGAIQAQIAAVAASPTGTSDQMLALIGLLQGAIQAALQEEIQAINAAADAERQLIQDNANLALDALELERDALEEQLLITDQLHEAARGMRDYLRTLRFGEFAAPVLRLAAATQELQRLANLARGGDVDAAGQVTGAADTALSLAMQTARSREEFERIKATILATVNSVANTLEALPSQEASLASIDEQIAALAVTTEELLAALDVATAAQIAVELANTAAQLGVLLDAVAALEALGPGYIGPALDDIATALTGLSTALEQTLLVELTATARSEIRKLILFVTDTDDFPADLRRIALDRITPELTKIIDYVVGSTLPPDLKRIVLNQVTDLAKLTNFTVGSTLSVADKRIVLNQIADLSKAIDFVVRADISEQDKRVALQITGSIRRVIALVVGNDNLTAEQKAVALQISGDVTRRLFTRLTPSVTPRIQQLMLAHDDILSRALRASISADTPADVRAFALNTLPTVNRIIEASFGGWDEESQAIILAASTAVSRAVEAYVGSGGNDAESMEIIRASSADIERAVSATGGTLTPEQRAIIEAAVNNISQLNLSGDVSLNPDGALSQSLEEISATTNYLIERILGPALGNLNLHLVLLSGQDGWLSMIYDEALVHTGLLNAINNASGGTPPASAERRSFTRSAPPSANDDLRSELAGVRSELAYLRAGMYAVAKNTGKTANTLDQWNGDGMPEERQA